MANLAEIIATIVRAGYRAWPVSAALAGAHQTRARRIALWRLFVAGFAMMQVMMYATPAYLAIDGEMEPDIEQLLRIASFVITVPLFFQRSTTEPVAGLKPYNALQLIGRDIYVREGCYNCHSQMIRPFRAETERVGGRYSDEWHRTHLNNPRDLVPESNMPGYPWMVANMVDGKSVAPRMKALARVGGPYRAAEVPAAPAAPVTSTRAPATAAAVSAPAPAATK